MESADYLIIPMLQGFIWFDEGLQNYLRLQGWPSVTRPQSMVMATVILGVTRPSDIARHLGVSRQAVHTTINGMVEIGLVELADDPVDGRSKIVVISEQGAKMREHAKQAVRLMSAELTRRIGADRLAGLHAALAADWGEPMTQFAVPVPAAARRKA
jgi:DNA-binding MarR family transcriptional regulator